MKTDTKSLKYSHFLGLGFTGMLLNKRVIRDRVLIRDRILIIRVLIE